VAERDDVEEKSHVVRDDASSFGKKHVQGLVKHLEDFDGPDPPRNLHQPERTSAKLTHQNEKCPINNDDT